MHSIFEYCIPLFYYLLGGPNVQPVHVSTFSQEIQGIVNMSIPRVVRSCSYPQHILCFTCCFLFHTFLSYE